jgi:N-acetylglucosamine-6-sulfatase
VNLLLLLLLAASSIFSANRDTFSPWVVNAQLSSEIDWEDNPPSDPVVANDPKVLAEFEKIDSAPSAVAVTDKPNIVFVMVGDTNPHDGRLWKKERTPAIYNNIISRGIRFTNAYGESPLCCPGRAGYLTGQHTHNHGVDSNNGLKFSPTVTLATELQSSGYYTMLIGKYINDFNKIPQDKAVPPGWSKFDGIYSKNGQYYNYHLIHKNGKTTYYGETASDYSTDVIANFAVKRLKEAPADKPIFAYITPYAVHGPMSPAPRHVGDARCRNISPWKPPDYNEQDVSDKPSYIKSLVSLPSGGFDITKHCEMMLSVDDLVRRVKNELYNQNRLRNTIFIFASDNGMSWGEHRWPNKSVPWSAHIPMYIAWPEGRGTAPRTESTFVSNIDIAPTLCEIAGCVMGPYPNGQTTSDGISILQLIKDQPLTEPRDAILTQMPNHEYNGDPSVRPGYHTVYTTYINPLGLWRYTEYENGDKELYDMTNGPCYKWSPEKGGDPCELNNLLRSDRTPTPEAIAVSQALSQRLAQLKAEKGYQTQAP